MANDLSKKYIILKGAREHNLQNINLTIPRDNFIVVTGLSGLEKQPQLLTQYMLKDKEDMQNHYQHMQDNSQGK